MKIQKPSQGRIVILALPHPGGPGPAGELTYNYTSIILTWKKGGLVTLRNLATLEVHNDVPHCATEKANTWHYPPPVKDEIEVAE